jgi:hypothetical protein
LGLEGGRDFAEDIVEGLLRIGSRDDGAADDEERGAFLDGRGGGTDAALVARFGAGGPDARHNEPVLWKAGTE